MKDKNKETETLYIDVDEFFKGTGIKTKLQNNKKETIKNAKKQTTKK